MRAVLCKELSGIDKLVVEEVETPRPGASELLVTVHAAGLNFPDVLMVQGKYQMKPTLPFSPGMEIAGVITEIGAQVEGFSRGDRVIANLPWGGFAEQVVVSPAQLVRMPAEVAFDAAAAFLLAYGTSYYALKQRAQIKTGETLVVLGAAGGVGLAAVQLGKLMGARVIACASSDDKLALCRKYGADESINYRDEDLKSRIKQLTGGAGADVIYDPVGGPFSEQALRAIGWGGRFLVVGFAAGDIPRIPLNLLLLKSCQLVGVFWGAFTMRDGDQNRANMTQLLNWLAAGKLSPHIGGRYPLADAARALGDMAERRALGKLVLLPGA